MDCSPPGSSVHGILQARILQWIVMPPPGDLSNPGIEPTSLTSPALTGRFFITSATWEAHTYCTHTHTHPAYHTIHTPNAQTTHTVHTHTTHTEISHKHPHKLRGLGVQEGYSVLQKVGKGKAARRRVQPETTGPCSHPAIFKVQLKPKYSRRGRLVCKICSQPPVRPPDLLQKCIVPLQRPPHSSNLR